MSGKLGFDDYKSLRSDLMLCRVSLPLLFVFLAHNGLFTLYNGGIGIIRGNYTQVLCGKVQRICNCCILSI